MFCLYNRYVDGLATWTPDDPQTYEEIGRRIAAEGYGSRVRKAERAERSAAAPGEPSTS